MKQDNPTLIGHVESVKGSIVTVHLRDMPMLIMIDGISYRIGQIGAFLRIPVGYNHLYGVCTLVGAAAAPKIENIDWHLGHRWMSITLFGEAVGNSFERGISQYPTIGDEVHLVTQHDISVIYSSTEEERAITVGHVAASSAIEGRIDLGRFVSRHSSIVGSTGSGKSNLVTVLLEKIASQNFPSARVLLIDPHGEYASALGQYGYVFKISPDEPRGEKPLYVPFWALPFDELREIALGEMQPAIETAVRDEITRRKKESAAHLGNRPPETAITADTPIPFSLKKLWFDLDDFERQTFQSRGGEDICELIREGNPETLESNEYPPASLGGAAPFLNPSPRRIGKQLELLKSRIQDARFRFLFHPGDSLTPDIGGRTTEDLDTLVSSWVGHERPITVLDVSGLPSETLSTIVGTLLRIVYDTLFWAINLPISGRNQPLLIVLEEAHIFLPEGTEGPAHRTISRIAKEGRKYGVGLCIVSQRPTEVDSSVLSQCGTMIALRLTNQSDRSRVESAMPDDLGAISSLLPSLRTGEGLIIGEAMPIPSRIQFFKAGHKPHGDDPAMPEAWLQTRPDGTHYSQALANWRSQSEHTNQEVQNG